MTFQEALTAMQAGREVRRPTWKPHVLSARLLNGRFVARTTDFGFVDYQAVGVGFADADLLAVDWELV